MWKNYFRFSWRSLLKDRLYSALNLMGLSAGLACTLLIYLWVRDEWSMDKFHAHDSRLYQVMHNISSADGIETIENTQGLLARSLKDEMPEVEFAASVIPATWFSNKGLVSVGDINLRASAQFISEDYFHMFSLHFLQGEKSKFFSDKYHVAISRELALKLFKSTDNIIGKTIEWNQEGFTGIYQVAGVFEKFPAHATAQFDMLYNYALFLEKNPKLLKWTNSDPSTYVLIKKGSSVKDFNKKLAHFIKSKNEKSSNTLFAQRYSHRYLHNRYEGGVPSGGRIEYVKLFSLIALFILIIACINFMNLSTARASRRLKEIGIKKLMGASRRTLIIQHMTEAMLMASLALIISILLVAVLLPPFNQITGKEILLRLDPSLVLALLSITLFTGLLAGSYPAIYLSKFDPVSVLKGKLRTSLPELVTRKGLVVFQFTLSIILIVSVLVVYQQIQLVQNKNLGYTRDQVLYFEKGGRISDKKEDYVPGGAYEKELESFMDKLKHIPGVVNASNFRHNITNRHGGTTAVTWEGKSPDAEIEFTDIAAGYDFIETLGIQMKEGRTYSRQFGSEKSKIILNEAAIEAMGLKNPVGKIINVWGEDKQIIGVTRNFHFESLYETIKPCFFDFSLNHRASKIMVKIKSRTEKATLARLSTFYKSYTGEPLDYRFLDDDYQALYASENRIAVFSGYFAILAILISCLGLLGLAAFTAQRRQKEIGIRKVVGATTGHVVRMLSGQFLQLILISLLIAFPLSWWMLNTWLDDFAYRIHIGPGSYLIAAFAILFITMLTISFQAIKAARTNPVRSLRSE